MNTSPVDSWQEFTASDTTAIYTWADNPTLVAVICGLVAISVVWFCVASYRLKEMRM